MMQGEQTHRNADDADGRGGGVSPHQCVANQGLFHDRRQLSSRISV